MRLSLTIFVAFALAVAGSALATSNSATITIKHQTRGCHSWSFDGKTWRASQSVTLVRGGTLAVVDDDVMPHTLVQVRGPKAVLARTTMKHMSSTAYVGFPTKGTYVFTTKAGEDYTSGVKTIGEDNVLKLVVTVT